MAKQASKKKTRKGRGQGSRRRGRAPQVVMPFGKRNYQLIGVGLILITIGYTIMYVESEVDGFWSLYVSPLILLAGYLGIIYAIIWRPTPADQET